MSLEERFKVYAAELKVCEEPHDIESLRDSIDFILDRAVKLKLVPSEPLETRIYHMTFPGRQNGEIRAA